MVCGLAAFGKATGFTYFQPILYVTWWIILLLSMVALYSSSHSLLEGICADLINLFRSFIIVSRFKTLLISSSNCCQTFIIRNFSLLKCLLSPVGSKLNYFTLFYSLYVIWTWLPLVFPPLFGMFSTVNLTMPFLTAQY